MGVVTKYVCPVFSSMGDKIAVIDTVIKVSTQGYFYCNIKDLCVLDYMSKTSDSSVSTNDKIISSATLDKLKAHLYSVYKAAYEVTIKKELVIRYTVGAEMAFTRAGGVIEPNGEGLTDPIWEQDDFFTGGLKFNRYTPCYSISLAAQPMICVIITRNDGSIKIKYESVSEHDVIDGKKLGYWGIQLNRWCYIHQGDNAQTVPYTEQAAQFFHNGMLSLVHLADNMYKFFKRPPEELINSMSGLLLPEVLKEKVIKDPKKEVS